MTLDSLLRSKIGFALTLPHNSMSISLRMWTMASPSSIPLFLWIACQIPLLPKGKKKGRYDLQTVSFWASKNATKIARLSKKSPTRFLGEMPRKMTSQNAPQSTISQYIEVMIKSTMFTGLWTRLIPDYPRASSGKASVEI
jgi:hypothetical protein